MPPVPRDRFSMMFFFALLLTLLSLAVILFSPFFGPLLCAVILAVIFYPLHHQWGRWWPRLSNTWRSLFSDAAVLLLFLIPFTILVASAVREFVAATPLIQQTARKASSYLSRSPIEIFPALQRLPEGIRSKLAVSTDVQETLSGVADEIIGGLAVRGAAFAKNTASFVLDLFVLLFALFFFFRDGESMLREGGKLLPLDAMARERLRKTVHSTIIGVVQGTFVTSLAQGAAATLIYFIVGLPAAFLLGFITFIATIIPSVGTALVWVPVSLYFFVTGVYWKGIAVAIWGVAVIGTIDNFLRPLVVGKNSDMPFFWLFFAILGGLQMFGIKGLLLGPLILAVLPVLFDLYQTRYKPADR